MYVCVPGPLLSESMEVLGSSLGHTYDPGRKFGPVRPNARSKGVVWVTSRHVTITCEQHSALGMVSTINI